MTDSESSLADECRLERMRPDEVMAAVRRCPLVYLPLGALEWHGRHAPLGLDGLTAQALGVRLARALGGVVFPVHYEGLWASLGHNPWTFLAEDDEAWIAGWLSRLARLEAQGVRWAFALSGHFSARQLAALTAVEHAWNAKRRTLTLAWRAVNQLPNPPVPPDHGGVFETALLAGLVPGAVQLERLAPGGAGDEPPLARRDPAHPLFGIVGADPRGATPELTQRVTQAMTTWLSGEVRALIAT